MDICRWTDRIWVGLYSQSIGLWAVLVAREAQNLLEIVVIFHYRGLYLSLERSDSNERWEKSASVTDYWRI